ncbi:MHYT domain-containing protein [Roseinatronobacter sp. S2]|uniref:MHYT domain-containing protein n=1 Tax=Roseinatronobacter sp. S2 TaxID=3035471 RepID=UPI00240F56E8|nr:MHYT domain-containing protein [Roseinatronobacter sp. S2]WFE74820.1 MHYT domain-containing protein [Roseinatronobacter sp. S2]
MLDYTHDTALVFASFAVALMAGFTGLSLTRGASELPVGQRKLAVAMAAVSLGGGIWSMHFVAMLGLQLPIPFYYDALTTLISALLAVLMTGVALLVVHFGTRTRGRIVLAGVIVGLGIPAMHYIGMSGMQLCRPVYSVAGVAGALLVSVALSVLAFLITYSRRERQNIVLGTAGFGLAVFTVHFIAMAGTGFVAQGGVSGAGPVISNSALAFGVTMAVFLISGAFLLTGVTFLPAPVAAVQGPHKPPQPQPVALNSLKVPYEKDGRTYFMDAFRIAAIQAEGHYTVLYVDDQKLFCPWAIAAAESRMPQGDFVRAHRSYLVNRRHVTGFERKKDTGICYFDTVPALGKVPVSRARLGHVREALGL